MSVFLWLLVTFDEIKVLSIYVYGFLDMMKCMTCSDCIQDIISMRLKLVWEVIEVMISVFVDEQSFCGGVN